MRVKGLWSRLSGMTPLCYESRALEMFYLFTTKSIFRMVTQAAIGVIFLVIRMAMRVRHFLFIHLCTDFSGITVNEYDLMWNHQYDGVNAFSRPQQTTYGCPAQEAEFASSRLFKVVFNEAEWECGNDLTLLSTTPHSTVVAVIQVSELSSMSTPKSSCRTSQTCH